jgi:acyl dehydratase
MSININAVKNWSFPVLRQTYSEKDTILYALSLGYGSQPASETELRFVYEHGLRAVPTMAALLCHPGFWISDPRTGIDASKAVHGEQRMTFHALLAVKGVVRGQTRVVDVIDKGQGKGALLVFERTLHDDISNTLLATIEQRTLCRGDGGFSASPVAKSAPDTLSASAPPPAVVAAPSKAGPTHQLDIHSLPQAALIYRLSADMNPLHADPAVARSAGFDRPILHGMCTYGIAARAIIQACCGNDPSVLRDLSARFSAPVFPGETIRTEIWEDSVGIRFQCLARERGVVIISNGVAQVGAAQASI